eukprot:16156824-Heterocapsa_arctica.AAC.1
MEAWDLAVGSIGTPASWELTQKTAQLQEHIQALADQIKTSGVAIDVPDESDVPAGKFQTALK